MNTTVGTCSICGGRVSVPSNWSATVPPTPTCVSCGATKKQPHGPVIETERSERTQPIGRAKFKLPSERTVREGTQ